MKIWPHPLLNGQCRQILVVRLHKASVPNSLRTRTPVRALNARSHETLLLGHFGVGLERLCKQSELAEVVKLAIAFLPLLMPEQRLAVKTSIQRVKVTIRSVEVRLVSRLQPQQIVP